MTDPLAGRRRAINEDSGLEHLVWPDRGRGAPVAVGDTFSLRSCSITITRTQRGRDRGLFVWVAWFRRVRHADRPYLLARGGGDDGKGYVRDPEAAIRAQDDEDAATIDRIDPEAESLEHADHRATTREPEPEGVPPDEVRDLPTSLAARARFASQRSEETARRLRRSLVEEIREAQLDAGQVERVRELVSGLRG